MIETTLADFRLVHRLRVRWAEVDLQKVVFNPHYLMYFDSAMTAYWRELALPYERSMAAFGGEPYVVKATVEFRAPARLDELLEVALTCKRLGTSSLTFEGAIFRDEQQLIRCELIYALADPQSHTAVPVPDGLRQTVLAYEAWEPMLQLELGTWQALGHAAGQIRTAVFREEQGIALDMGGDPDDNNAVHVLARNRLGLPVATGRLLQHAPGVGRIGRVAVDQALRGANLGRAVMRALMQAAAQRGDHEVFLHSQRSARGFYEQLGFVARGEPFEEGGRVHFEMAHPLTPPE